MKRLLHILILLSFCCIGFSEENEEENIPLIASEQLASYISDDFSLIGGLISPISGNIVLNTVDLIAKGAQEIILSRNYLSPYLPCSFHKNKKKDEVELYLYTQSNYQGWVFLPHLKLRAINKDNVYNIRLVEPHGATLEFEVKDNNTKLLTGSYGISNISQDIPGRKNDIRNILIKIIDDGSFIIIISPDGAERYYHNLPEQGQEIAFYLMEKEILPNGKVLRYFYDNRKLFLIESKDPKETHTYASIKIENSPYNGESCDFITQDGEKASYNYEKRKLETTIKKKNRKNYYKISSPPILTFIGSPYYRNETISYNDKFLLAENNSQRHVFKCDYKSFGTSPHYKVNKLFFPIEEKDDFISVYDIDYDAPIAEEKEGLTTVTKNNGTSIAYHISKNLLVDSIKYYDQFNTLKKEKKYFWKDNGYLSSLELNDGNGNRFYKKSFEYDKFGNPLLEMFIGDLSGNKEEESYFIKKEYSLDEKNLLIKEEKENGLITTFKYVPNTNLIKTNFTGDKNRILIRKFFEYDDCNNLISIIIDDGSSKDKNDLLNVTERQITKYVLRQQQPFLHMIEWIEEKYLESNEEKFLRKTHLVYDKHGNIIQEDVYDSVGNFAYSIYKEYNESGKIVSETNPLGQKACYKYDEKGRCIFSKNFSNRLKKEMIYDAKGRLKILLEKGSERNYHNELYDYDSNDNLIKKEDMFGNITNYEYDPIVNKPNLIKYPSIESTDEQNVSVIKKSSYNGLGFETGSTDANGNVTYYEYNSYGSPVKIIYPDGNIEKLFYYKDGKLFSHMDLEGLTIYYNYDVLGRIISKIYYKNEKEIAEEIFQYNSFHLLEKTDKEKNVTKYGYDKAGRKIKEEFEGRTEEYFYDNLGRVYKICNVNGENSLFTYFEKNLLDQILDEKKTNLSGTVLYNISYTYDEDGNRSSIVRNINGKKAVDAFFYDSFNRLIEHKDTLGYVTTIIYDEHYINPFGQNVLKTTTLNPKNISNVRIFNVLGKLSKHEILNFNGNAVLSEDLYYDPESNMTEHHNHIYKGSSYQKTVKTKYEYDNRNRQKSLIRAFCSNDQRYTYYDYTPTGMLKSTVLPDGTILSYTYDDLGYLKSLKSSDGQIDQIFSYNKEGFLLEAFDYVQNTFIKRKPDPFGNVLREKFSNGLFIEKTYDQLDRPLTIKLADEGTVQYKHDPFNLKRADRYSPDNTLLYTHSCDICDLNGFIVSETLPSDLGEIFHERDVKGRAISIISPYWNQKCTYDESDNITQISINEENTSYDYDDLSQLVYEKTPGKNYFYKFDSNYNRTSKDDSKSAINDLDELLSLGDIQCSYDKNGNLISKKTPEKMLHYKYDPLNRLVEVISCERRIKFTYDPLGRRLSKIVLDNTGIEKDHECYLYDGNEEIGAFSNDGKVKHLKILGNTKAIPKSIAIEINGKIFIPLIDSQGNIHRLLDCYSKTIAEDYDFTAFGEKKRFTKNYSNPWQYKQKRTDRETGLIYFGKRYYDPELGKWLTTDPSNFTDSINLYQYVWNNPLKYQDLYGENLTGFFCGIGQILLGGAIMATGVGLEIATLGGYTFALGLHEAVGMSLMFSGCTQAIYNSGDISFEKRSSRPNPDSKAEGWPHTIVERPGPGGQYTTHNGDNTFKQYRGAGKSHGGIPRPNVKENKNNLSPSGLRPGKPEVRKPRADEIPKGK